MTFICSNAQNQFGIDITKVKKKNDKEIHNDSMIHTILVWAWNRLCEWSDTLTFAHSYVECSIIAEKNWVSVFILAILCNTLFSGIC